MILKNLTVTNRQSLRLNAISKLSGRLDFARLMDLPESDFSSLISEIENSELFKKLVMPGQSHRKLIYYERFPKTAISPSLLPLDEQSISYTEYPAIDDLLQRQDDLISVIRCFGEDKFLKYFIYCTENLTAADIAEKCDIRVNEVERIRNLVNQVILREGLLDAGSSIKHKQRYIKIASLERDKKGHIRIVYFSIYHARGRYKWDLQKIDDLKKGGYFSKAEKKTLPALLKKLELINSRKNLIFRIIKKIIEKQREFLIKGESEYIKSYLQKLLADDLNVNPSLISRALWGKSIETPWKEELPLKYFFPNRKKIVKNYVEEIILNCKNTLSDRQISEALKRKYNIVLSRRSVALYRKELKIKSSVRSR